MMSPHSDILALSSNEIRKITSEKQYQSVFVLGPSSSGKTMLCDALFQALKLKPAGYIKEIARKVMNDTGFSRADTATYEMQAAIMFAQLKAEVDVLNHASVGDEQGLLLLSDRSAVDPIIYASTANTPTAAENRERLLEDSAFQAVLPLYRQSLVIVLKPVQEWMFDDGVRSLEDPRKYNKVLTQTLKMLRIRYVEIGEEMKVLEERVGFVKKLLGERDEERN